MVFLFFAAGIAAIFFLASLIALHCGRALGLRYRTGGGKRQHGRAWHC
jgi:hypothetical protein